MKDWTLDKVIHWTTGLVVTIVALLAAIKSYEHIYILGHHDPILPLCIDGMIIAASLVLLTASRASFGTLWFARLTLWLGIVATMGANLAYGLPQGWEAGTRAIWPAVCFVFTELTVMQLAKAKKKRRVPATPARHAATVPTTLERKEKTRESVGTGQLVAAVSAPVEPTPTKRVNTVMSIAAIRDALKCGQPKATDVQKIMREQGVSLATALKIREEVKLNVSKK